MARIKTFTKKIIPYRVYVQLAFLAVWLDPLGFRYHKICAPVFHCYACPMATFGCPIGTLAHFAALHTFPFLTVGILLIAAAIFGGFICGWACPFGLLQDLAHHMPTKKFELPLWTNKLRYVSLFVFVLAIPYFLGDQSSLFFCTNCPVGAIEAAVPGMVQQASAGETVVWPNAVKLSITVFILVSMFFVSRPWCRICPLGAIFGLFNRFSAFFLKIDDEKCTGCNVCHKLCKTSKKADPSSASCIGCLECAKCGPNAITIGSVFNGKKSQEADSNGSEGKPDAS